MMTNTAPTTAAPMAMAIHQSGMLMSGSRSATIIVTAAPAPRAASQLPACRTSLLLNRPILGDVYSEAADQSEFKCSLGAPSALVLEGCRRPPTQRGRQPSPRRPAHGTGGSRPPGHVNRTRGPSAGRGGHLGGG